MRNKKLLIIHGVFVAIQFILTILFFFVPLPGRSEVAINFTIVVLALLHAVIVSGKSPHKKVFITAMIFTVISDVFLTVRYTRTGSSVDQIIAMFTFSCTQICYAVYLFLQSQNKKLKEISIGVRVGLIVLILLIAILVLKQNINLLVIVTIFYFTNLVLNAVFAFIEFKKNPLFAIGLVFFIFCDILIGLGVMNKMFITIAPDSFLYKIVFQIDFAWLFYSISQTLISLSISAGLAFLRKGEKIEEKVQRVYHR